MDIAIPKQGFWVIVLQPLVDGACLVDTWVFDTWAETEHHVREASRRPCPVMWGAGEPPKIESGQCWAPFVPVKAG